MTASVNISVPDADTRLDRLSVFNFRLLLCKHLFNCVSVLKHESTLKRVKQQRQQVKVSYSQLQIYLKDL